MKKNKLKSLLSKLEETTESSTEDMLVSLNQQMAKRIVTHYYGGNVSSNETCSNNGRCSGNETCSNNGKCSGNDKCSA